MGAKYLAIVRKSSEIDSESAKANMYGCQPCPRCESRYRYRYIAEPNMITCDDCGLKEETTRDYDKERSA
jgi:hypothetical protein